jgi:hypothetical protein
MRYYIYTYWQQGNVGPKQVEILEDQPMEGFATEDQAEQHLLKLIEAREGRFFTRPWYNFTILKTWKSKSALDKITRD